MVVLACLAILTLTAVTGPSASGDSRTTDVVAFGAEVYAFHCAVCHGATGQGFGEARSAFPPDHRSCTRCHRPQNPTSMSLEHMGRSQTAFSLGDPPPLDDAQVLARFGTAEALYGYIKSTLPRWNPDGLADAEYRAVTLHVLRQAGSPSVDDDSGLEDLDAVLLNGLD